NLVAARNFEGTSLAPSCGQAGARSARYPEPWEIRKLALAVAIAAAAATASAPASAAAVSATATGWALFAGPRFVDRQWPALKVLLVEHRDGFVGLFLRAHLNERKTARTASRTVLHYVHPDHR